MMVLFVSIAFYIEIIKTSTVSGDSGHHLYYANLIHVDGLTPIKDFVCEYSPLGYYCFDWFWSLFGHTYSVAVALMMVCGLWITFWTSLIAKRLLNDPLAAWITGAITLPSWIVFQGGHPFLEPFVVAGLMPAAYFYLFNEKDKHNLLKVGCLLGMALLGKQWALFFIVMFIIDVLLNKPTPLPRLKALIYLTVPIGLPFVIFAFLNGISLWEGFLHMATYGHQEYPMTFPPFPKSLLNTLKCMSPLFPCSLQLAFL